MSQQEAKLEKNMSSLGVWALALGAMIGWGCFVMPGDTLLPDAGPIGASIGLALGAAMIILISFSYSYLISKYPVAGGEFVYANTVFGKTHAFVCGWFLMLAYWALIPMNGTAVGLVVRYIFPGPLQSMPLYEIAGWTVYGGELIVDIAAIVIIGFINMRGGEAASWFGTAVALGLCGSMLVIASAILMGGVDWSNLQPLFSPEKSAVASILSVAALAPWAYVGFGCIPQTAEEMSFSNKKTAALLVSSISIAGLMYIVMNIATAVVQPWQQFIVDNSNWATGAAVEALIGNIGLLFLAIAMICGIVSGLNAFYLSGSRLLYSMAIADALPDGFKKLDSKYHVPRLGIMFMMILAVIAPFFGRQVLSWLVDMTAIGADLAFLYATAAALVIAVRERNKKQILISGAGTLFSVAFILLLLIPGSPGFLSPQAWAFLVVWVVIGGIFFAMKRKDYYASTALEEKVATIAQEVEAGVFEGVCDEECLDDLEEQHARSNA